MSNDYTEKKMAGNKIDLGILISDFRRGAKRLLIPGILLVIQIGRAHV